MKPENALVRTDDRAADGPAMRALPTDKMRLYVQILVEAGCPKAQAAIQAGYSPSDNGVTSRLSHDTRVQAAILEESIRAVRADLPMGLAVFRSIASDLSVAPRDRITAAKELVNRGGMNAVAEHRLEVSFQSEKDKDRDIISMGKELGWDDAMIAKAIGKPIVTDAVFVEVIDPPTEIAPAREAVGAKITSATRTAEARAMDRRRAHETTEEAAERKARIKADRQAAMANPWAGTSPEYEAAQSNDPETQDDDGDIDV